MQPDIKTFIIYEDPHIIVCHKPAGMPVQSARIGAADLVSLLKNHLASSARNTGASKPPYLAVIHRLDQPARVCKVACCRQRFKPAAHLFRI